MPLQETPKLLWLKRVGGYDDLKAVDADVDAAVDV